jgi:hypothetical protein
MIISNTLDSYIVNILLKCFFLLVLLSRSSEIITQTFKSRFTKSSDVGMDEDGQEYQVRDAVGCIHRCKNSA